MIFLTYLYYVIIKQNDINTMETNTTFELFLASLLLILFIITMSFVAKLLINYLINKIK